MSKPSLPFAMTKLNADRIVSWSAIFVSDSRFGTQPTDKE